MAQKPNTPIIITDGKWMHIRQIQTYHRRYPEIRGEGRTRLEALAHLANQLVSVLDSTSSGGGREAAEQALNDIRATRHRVTHGQIIGISKVH